ncbi:MAG: hypothetical protein ABMB14_36790, partial [Myxococcota bacterium]
MPILLAVSLASASGPAIVGPPSADPSSSPATRISVSPDADGTTIVLAVQVAATAPSFAVLWPAAGLVPTSVASVDTSAFDQLDRTTRPRVAGLTCDDLIATTHWSTVPA